VALYFEEHDKAFVQAFTYDGPTAFRIGLPLTSELAHIDRNYLWHANWDTWITSRFVRSTHFDISL
jgi:hypothetical protein